MKTLKFILIILFCQTILYSPLCAGDIAADSVPTEINYQGRLEKDNAPITGPVHITFRIYDVVTGGAAIWNSGEIIVNAVQGIFSASIEPPWSVFSVSEARYLEIQIESDVLSPREPFQSAAFSLVAKRLEDGSNISITSMTTTGNVGIGTASPDKKLVINGGVRILTDGLYFPDSSFMGTAGVGSQGSISTADDAIIMADNNNDTTGDIIFRTGIAIERMRINNAGNVAIGNTDFNGKLDMDGSLYIGNEGIYDRDDGEVNIMENLGVAGGVITGDNSEFISIGVLNNVIALNSGGSERMRVHSNGYVGIGVSAPSQPLDVNGNIYSNAGIRGGNVTIGNYSAGNANEIRNAIGDLLLQQTNSTGKVGIGTASPSEKLHVHGSIKADNGIIASTAAFSENVYILGNLVSNNPLGSSVELSSTIIYGTLHVTGGIGSAKGDPAYLASTQTFSGENTFSNKITASNDIISWARIGVGVIDFDHGAGKYLQIGDDRAEFVNDNALAYLVAGSNADSKIQFYRGSNEAARLETQGGNNFAIIVANEAKALIDSSDFRIFNSAVYISTAQGTPPAIYVSPIDGNVGMGTTVTDPNWQLTVDGNIRISGPTSNGVIFADGTTLTTAGGGSANALSNDDDVLIRSDADNSGGGDVIINAGSVNGIFVNSGGNIGMGTQTPISKLNIRGGDLVLGNPDLASYASNGVEDLIIAGSLIVDGGFSQRSAAPVEFSALTVSGDVSLSTAATARTGIGTDSPSYRLDVTDDINASGNIRTGGIIRISAAGAWEGATIAVGRGGTGSNLSAVATGGIIYKSGAATMAGTGALTGVLKGNGAGAPTTMTGTANYSAYWSDANTISAEQYTNVTRGGTGSNLSAVATGGIIYKSGAATMTGTGALTGVLKGNGAGAPTAMTGISGRVTKWSDNNTIGASSILTDDGARFTVNSPLDIIGGLTTDSSGTFKAAGNAQYSILTSSGIRIMDGLVDMNSAARIVNLPDPSSNQDAATKAYVDSVTGGGSGAWGLTGNNIGGGSWLGTSNNSDLEIRTDSAVRMTITSGGAIQLNNALGVAYGGTGAGTDAGARTNLGLGSIATQASNNVSITGGAISGITDLAIADGGTGSSTDAGARTNLGLGSIATQTSDNVLITGGAISGITDLAIADGGTGSSTDAGARTNLGLGSGLSNTYTVVIDSDPYSCQDWTFTNGILTTVGAGVCP